jgi:hypothetical protein
LPGELREVKKASYQNFIGIFGLHRFFHTPEDTIANTGPEALEPMVRAFAKAITLIVERQDSAFSRYFASCLFLEFLSASASSAVRRGLRAVAGGGCRTLTLTGKSRSSGPNEIRSHSSSRCLCDRISKSNSGVLRHVGRAASAATIHARSPFMAWPFDFAWDAPTAPAIHRAF